MSCTWTEFNVKKRVFVKTVEIAEAFGATSGNNAEWEKDKSIKDARSVSQNHFSLAGYRFRIK